MLTYNLTTLQSHFIEGLLTILPKAGAREEASDFTINEPVWRSPSPVKPCVRSSLGVPRVQPCGGSPISLLARMLLIGISNLLSASCRDFWRILRWIQQPEGRIREAEQLLSLGVRKQRLASIVKILIRSMMILNDGLVNLRKQ